MKYSMSMTQVLNHNLVIGQNPPAGRRCYVMIRGNRIFRYILH